VFLLVLTTVSGIGLRGQVPAESRTFLLFYDDLHMEFGSTPRIRELTLRMVTDLAREGDRWALVSTGTSSVSVAPTSDAAIVKSAIRRVTGNGLTARSFLDARQQTDGVLETRRRAALAFSTATDAIEGVSAAQSGRPLAILYVSNGYDVGAIAEPTELLRVAAAANAHLYTIDPRGLANVAASQGVSQAEWATYLDATREVLRTLASQTQGMTVFTDVDLDIALSRLAARGR
jgi:hypothetical protein